MLSAPLSSLLTARICLQQLDLYAIINKFTVMLLLLPRIAGTYEQQFRYPNPTPQHLN